MSSECPEPPTTLSQICENVIGVDPWWEGFIKQEQYSPPGCRVDMNKMREMMQAAFNLGAAERPEQPLTMVMKWVIECQQMLAAATIDGVPAIAYDMFAGINTNLTMIEQQLNEGVMR